MPVSRRFVLALLGIVSAAFLLRAQVADALVIRGDESLYRRQVTAALKYYGRATFVDSDDATAVDRLAFAATLLHDPEILRRAIATATRYLNGHQGDVAIRMDRAMAERATKQTKAALADFANVGAAASDARALTFAAYEADALGRHGQAAVLFRHALALAPGFPAARHGLLRENARL